MPKIGLGLGAGANTPSSPSPSLTPIITEVSFRVVESGDLQVFPRVRWNFGETPSESLAVLAGVQIDLFHLQGAYVGELGHPDPEEAILLSSFPSTPITLPADGWREGSFIAGDVSYFKVRMRGVYGVGGYTPWSNIGQFGIYVPAE